MNRSLQQVRILVLLILLAATGFLRSYPQERGPGGLPEAIQPLPEQIGAWKGKDTPIDPQLRKEIAPSLLLEKNYTLEGSHPLKGFARAIKSAANVDVLVTYIPDGDIIHMPARCLIGSGWTIVTEQERQITHSNLSFKANLIRARNQGREEQQIYFLCGAAQSRSEWLPTAAYSWRARRLLGVASLAKVQCSFGPGCLKAGNELTPEVTDFLFAIRRAVQESLKG